MRGQRVLLLAVLVMVGIAGCLGAAGTPTPNTTDTPTTSSSGESGPNYTAITFDHADIGGPVIDNGLTYAPENTTIRQSATIIATASERDRFDIARLARTNSAAANFVNATDFSNASLLIYQVTPASSVPDHRVETVQRSGDTVTIAINDSAVGGTADITVETVLVRLQGTAPERVVFTTEDDTTTVGD